MNIKYKYIKVNDWTKVPKEGAFEVEYTSGSKEWWLDGQQHRIDGPAVECASGSKAWYLNGKHYLTEKEYWLALLKHELISKEEAFELCLSL